MDRSAPNALSKLWGSFFVAVLLMVPAAVVSGAVGVPTGQIFWIMGIAAHRPMLSVTNLSFGRRLAIWLTGMTAGVLTAGLGAIAISGLLQITAPFALAGQTADEPSARVTNLFWVVVAIRFAITWAPVIVAWAVSGVLVRRSFRRRSVASPSAPTRPTTQDLKAQTSVVSEDVQNEGGIQGGGASAGSLRMRTTTRRRVNIALIVAKAGASILLLFGLLVVAALLKENVAGVIGVVGQVIVIAAYAPSLFYVWASASLRVRARDRFGRWLSRDWRLVPLYAAAILVSIAALRYILSE